MSTKNIEDAYPLSPLQEGMLFHSLEEPEQGVYVIQHGFTLAGRIDADAFEFAWKKVMSRHAVLRTAFAWKNAVRPVQVVGREVKLPLVRQDWSELSPEERQQRWSLLLEEDRMRGFDPARAPLMRLHLIRESDEVYRFLWTRHHMLMDGWSAERVMGEVLSIYEARCQGREPDLPPSRPFRDYIAWLGKQDLSRAEDFWRRELAGITAPTPLVAGGERPTGPAGAQARFTMELPPDLAEALRALVRTHKLTLNTLAQGAWALVLGRYSGEDDVVFGVTVSGRPPSLQEVEGMVGLFINTLPFRVDVRPGQPIADWLRSLLERQLEMRQYEFSPLPEVHGWSEVPRHLPLFDTYMVFENYPDDTRLRRRREGLEVIADQWISRVNYPIIFEGNSHLVFDIYWDSTRVDAALTQGMLTHLVALLESFAGNAAADIGNLPMLVEAERQQLLGDWQGLPAARPAAICLHELFAAQVARTPEATAVEFDGRRLSYAELAGEVGRLASRLRALGVGPETVVAVCLERSLALPVTLLAIFEAGGAYLPLDPALPRERMAWMLEDSRATVVVTERRLAGGLTAGGRTLLCLDEEAGEVAATPAGAQAGPDNAAYVIYTSGSTGRPKGVVNTHRAIANRLLWMQETFPLTAADAVLQKTPYSFDASIWELFLPLITGARLVMAVPGGHQDPAYLTRAVADNGVTVLQLVPSMLGAFLEAEGIERCGLRRLFCGGEALTPELRDRCFATLDAELCNLYGPTECSIDVTFWPCAREDRRPLVPIGRPIANVAVHLLDRHLRLVPQQAVGELYAGGAGLARGYLGRADLTAERFVPDPFSGQPGARLYRTGDLARRLPDGAIEYMGRIDHQVKVRGYRIELGEIEAVLAQAPGVRESAVLVKETATGDRQIVGYAAASPPPGAEALRAFLSERLPEYMVPIAFVTLDALPRSTSGKIDRWALAQIEPEQAERPREQPRTQVQELLAGIWSEVLGVERIGLTDDFFELGGHSLLVTQVTSRVRALFGVKVRMRTLFERRTLAELAPHVESLLGTDGAAPAVPLEPVARDLPLPLSFSQQRLWFIDQFDPGNSLYNLPAAVRLLGRLDARVLRAAITEIMRRHEVLRTTYPTMDGEPVQTIAPPSVFPLPLVDLQALSKEQAENEVLRLAAEDAMRPFDLEHGPVLRGSLLRIGQQEHVALFNLHHIAGDAWSMGIFVRELGALYRAFLVGLPSALPELGIQYADFASWQRRWLSGEVLDEQLRHWRERLAGAAGVLDLPFDRPRTMGAARQGARLPITLPVGLLEDLQGRARQEGVTTFMLLLAALQGLLARYSGQDDVSVGTPVAGRDRLETEALIGFFINTLVLRTEIDGDATGRGLLGRVREVTLSAFTHQDLPFERLVEEIQPERSLSLSPLFQVMFGLQNDGLGTIQLPGLVLEPVGERPGIAKFDLGLMLNESDQGFAGFWEYNLGLFDTTTVARLGTHFGQMLAGLVHQPDEKLQDLPLISDSERQQLLTEWNDTGDEGAAPTPFLPVLFAEQAARTPEATALEMGGERLTYREVDELSNRLARFLRRQGIGPDTRVALCLDRSFHMVIGILGVMKAGGAYVPLDPSYPVDRLSFILADALGDTRAPVLLTQAPLAGLFAQAEGVPAALEVVCLDSGWDVIARESAGALPVVSLPDSLAYLIYTSGSTGRPKGVALTNAGLANLCAAQMRLFGLGAGDRVLQFSSFSFDLSLWEVAMALASGATLCLASRAELLPGPELSRKLRDLEITTVTLPPAAVAVLEAEDFPHLHTLIVGGEAWTVELAQRWGNGRRLFNGYGPTEITVCASAGLYQTGSGRLPLGFPIYRTRFYVLDRGLNPVPAGVSGELYIAGPGLARGYLNRPDLTAEVFVPDSASGGVAGERLYRTGDAVRRLATGEVEFLGRVGHHQVKIRGFRVELGEIEAVLLQIPEVQEAVVLLREDRPGELRLTAYVVPRSEAASRDEMRAFLKGRLPDYMVPAAFVLLTTMPLLSSGKVDRRALARLAPPPEAAAGDQSFVAPRTATEELVAGLFAEVLHCEQVGAYDDFFDLGGHSLLATSLVSRLRSAVDVDLPLRVVFEHPTVAALAQAVEAERRAVQGWALPPIQRVPRDRDLPLSFSQQRLWFLQQMAPESSTYNMPVVLRVKGALDVAVLAGALDEIVRRHEALRTTFHVVGGEPFQRIGPAVRQPLPLVDLSGLAELERAGESLRVAEVEARVPFDLSRGPVLRIRLVRLETAEHLVLFTIHHVVSDEVSMQVLVRELTSLYPALVAGRPSPLPELAVQYADFAVWQRQWLQGEVLDAQRRYWAQQLGGELATLELPTDYPRPLVQTHRGARMAVAIPQEAAEALYALGRQEQCTSFMTFLGAFQVLLHRLTGQRDIPVGTLIAGRHHQSLEDLIGFFSNTLVMRGDVGGEQEIRQVLRQARKTALEAYANQDLPFERLVEELKVERDLSRTPLFQVVFTLQTAGREELRFPGLELEQVAVESGSARFDLTLSLARTRQGLFGAFEFNLDLFDPATIERFIGHFATLLQGIAAAPETPVADLPLLSREESRTLLCEWGSGGPGAGTVAIPELFDAQVEERPDAVAVVFGDEQLTYGALARQANRLAHHLCGLGVGPEVLVGLCADRSVEMVIGLLGIAKAGGAYVPLDPAYPLERLAFMLEDTLMPVLVGQDRLIESLPVTGLTQLVLFEADRLPVARQSASRPAAGMLPESLAYVMYTSGSTGQPKGVAVTHQAVARLVRQDSYASFGPEEVFLQLAPISFDASTLEIWGALLNGARLVVAPPRMLALEELGETIARHGVSTLWLTAGLFHEMVEEHLAGLAPVRQMIAGGDVLLPSRVRRVLEAFPGCRVINGYGPTENTTFTCCHPMAEPGDVGVSVSIGRPIAGTEVYVVDGYGNPVPAGVAGELLAGGLGLARGYANRPALTAEAWRPDAVSGRAGERVYHTGDRVRWQSLNPGRLEFLGRLDHQVKVRGFRIEPGEIEAVLAADPRVREVVVLVREDTPGDKRLIAYAVADPGLSTAHLRELVEQRLPDYMVPSRFLLLDALPLTPNGKVDRKALPAPEELEAGAETEYIAPRNPVEEVVAAIWSSVLKVERVGARDNFFDLGGHSLLATRVVSQLRSAFHLEIGIQELFEAPTVAGLSREIERLTRDQDGTLAPPIVRVSRDGDLPLSFAQQRLWFLHHLEPGSSAYNIPVALRLLGRLEIGAIAATLGEVWRRHEVLRTNLPASDDGIPMPRISPPGPIDLPVIDLGSLPAPLREEAAALLARDEAERPFDLATGPLLRVTLLRLAAEDHMALLTMHHIVSDAWSIEVLVREVQTIYDAVRQGRPSPLPELPVQYVDFAHWQRRWMQGDVLEAQLAYWRRQLAGMPSGLDLPTDRPRPAVQGFAGKVHSFLLPDSLTSGLAALCRNEGVTLYMTLLAAFQGLLRRTTGSKDISIGTPIAGRDRLEIEPLIGFFLNTLVLRVDLPGDPDFRALLARVRQVALEAYGHQDLPFEKLVDAMGAERDLGRTPLFQVMFTLQNIADRSGELTDLRLSHVPVETRAAKFDLELQFVAQAGRLHGLLLYRTDLFDHTTAARMTDHLQRLLAGAVSDPGLAVSAMPLLDQAELAQVVREWNDSARSYPGTAGISGLHHWIERQVDRSPEEVALVFGADRLTYRELDQRANQLAHYLRGFGVGPETLVGVAVERSLEMVIGLLGILKAGGAYVPIDPSYPEERVRFMLEDSGVPVLLTQEHLLSSLPIGLWEMGTTQIIDLDADRERLDRQPTDRPQVELQPDNPAYVIYTSGSTGRPKGAINTHRAIINRLLWMQEAYSLTAAEDRVLQKTPFSFDVSVWEFFWPLLTGARLVLARPGGHQDPAYLIDLIVGEGVTTLHFVPSMLRAFLDAPGVERCTGLRRVIASGEALPPDLVRRFQVLPAAELHNLYGPTEAAVDVTFWRCEPGEKADLVPIGRPIANLQIHVLDADLRPVGIGVHGELHIGGVGLARGYHGRPALTAERFIPDPLSESGGARLYRTGDLVRRLADGSVDYLGRLDHQVKLRGFRIELGEIEAALQEHPGVRDAVVLAREDGPGGLRLVAYVVPEPDELPPPGPADLQDFLRTSLPAFMVPSAVVLLAAFPLSPNGKLDRAALPAPEAPQDPVRGHVPPRGPVEEILASIWAEVLGLGQVGAHDNFFELGGDSILGLQVVARAHRRGLGLTPRDLFQYPTLSELAAVVDAAKLVATAQGPVTGPVPLTPIQHHFFAVQTQDPHHFNQAVFLELKERIAPAVLDQAIGHLLVHHDALRLRFVRDGEVWTARNAEPEAEVPLVSLDLSVIPAARWTEAIRVSTAAAQGSCHITAGPLVRAVHFDLGEEGGTRLLFIIHHLAVDGVSWRILLDDFETICRQLVQGKDVELPLKSTSFKAWSERLSEYTRDGGFDQEWDYWLAIQNADLAPLPQDLFDGENTFASSRSVRCAFESEETMAVLQDIPKAFGAQAEDVLLAAVGLALRRWTGSSSVLVMLEGHGREPLFANLDVSRTVGWFTTMAPLLLELGMASSPDETLKVVKEQIRSLPRGGVGFGALKYLSDDLDNRERLGDLPPAYLLFNYLGQLDRVLPASSLFQPARESSGRAQGPLTLRELPLELTARIMDGRLEVTFTYSENLHRRDSIEELAAIFAEELRTLISHCQAPEAVGYTPSDFPHMELSQEELDELLSGLSTVED